MGKAAVKHVGSWLFVCIHQKAASESHSNQMRKDALSLVDVCFGHSTMRVILLIHKLFYAEET